VKHAATLLLALVGCLSFGLRAEDGSAPAVRVQDRIVALFPAYSPEEHARAMAEKAAVTTAAFDPELIILPEFTVQESFRQRLAEETLYLRGTYDKVLIKRELAEFDRYFLNRFQLGLNLGFLRIGIGDGNEARAREKYLARKRLERDQRLNRLAEVVSTQDPQEARELRRLSRDLTWAERPSETNTRPINLR
jgi:hypothetical protein